MNCPPLFRAAALAALGLALTGPGAARATFLVVSGAGATPASIQGVVDQFRAALGTPDNFNAAGPLAGGRREINWDGGGSTATAVVGTPFNGFLNNRGASFTTPGTGFIQATASGLATQFSNTQYATIFTAFSPQRLFAPTGSTITDVTFFVPGTAGGVPATVAGFGAVFADVDLANTTRLQFFDPENNEIFNQAVAAFNEGLSFLGAVATAGQRIARVRITTGNSPLGATDGGSSDVVVMDDFFYSEPVAVPVPPTLGLAAIGLLGLGAYRRWRVT
jgi:hypothetical protein